MSPLWCGPFDPAFHNARELRGRALGIGNVFKLMNEVSFLNYINTYITDLFIQLTGAFCPIQSEQ